MNTKAPLHRVRAFSLVELLVVISIIAIIAGFAVPAVTTMIRGSALTQGSQSITDQIILARQVALSRNRSVEVRFYKFADPEIPGEDPKNPQTGFFRACQTFEILDNGGALPTGGLTRLPVGVIMNEDKLSTILKYRPLENPKPSDPALPDTQAQRNYQYVALRFLPDGSTDLPPTGVDDTGATGTSGKNSDSWYLTIHGTQIQKSSGAESVGKTQDLPDNFFTLQIDPITGSTRSYRPTAGG
jgi:uncharacterized protein (TIGR02596 family)